LIAFEDMLFDALAPATATRHCALVRLEDISLNSDATELNTVAQWPYTNKIPYGFNVISRYKDPHGTYNNGVAQDITLAANNPHNGVTGDDSEFFRAHVDASNNVVLDGTVPEDTTAWANARLTESKTLMTAAGLPPPVPDTGSGCIRPSPESRAAHP
jgi:hypothetical protein